jgi:hypothetical protein
MSALHDNKAILVENAVQHLLIAIPNAFMELSTVYKMT